MILCCTLFIVGDQQGSRLRVSKMTKVACHVSHASLDQGNDQSDHLCQLGQINALAFGQTCNASFPTYLWPHLASARPTLIRIPVYVCIKVSYTHTHPYCTWTSFLSLFSLVSAPQLLCSFFLLVSLDVILRVRCRE